jgi:geranylgeranyl pyrophosphate synthase
MLWNDRSVDWLVERGADKPRVQEALGILLTSEHSHQRAYTTLEAEMVDLVYDELTRMADTYREEINARLAALLGDRYPLHTHANEVLLSDGAKRFRAYLFVLAAEMFGVDHASAVNLSTVYELFHAASLVHDDIMDGADRRRGRSTLHKQYGLAEAIIAGDLMMLKTFEVLARDGANLPRERLSALLQVIGETGEKCCLGQSLDMELARERRYKSADEYRRMVELKTGSLVEGAVHGGALLGTPNSLQLEHVARMGCSLGAAFQIVDDSLDLIGDNANKSVRNDLKQAKATPMLIHALAVVDQADRDLLLGAVGNKRLSARTAAEVTDLYRRCGAVRYAQQLSREYVDAAREALRGLPDGESRRVLRAGDRYPRLLGHAG